MTKFLDILSDSMIRLKAKLEYMYIHTYNLSVLLIPLYLKPLIRLMHLKEFEGQTHIL